MKPSRRAPIICLDDNEEDIGFLRRLIAKATVQYPFYPLLSAEAFMTWLPTVFAPRSKVERPVVLFLDVKMPRRSGFDVLAWIRTEPAFNPLPVVMLSMSDDPRDLRQAVRLGAQGYLTKYPTVPVLREVVADAAAYFDARDEDVFNKPYNLLSAEPGRKPRASN